MRTKGENRLSCPTDRTSFNTGGGERGGEGEGEGRVRLDDIQKSLLTPAIL